MTYPEVLIVAGVEHEIRTSYLDALACIACINDQEISDTERAYGVIGLLYLEPPEDAEAAISMAVRYLRMDRDDPESSTPPDMDFEQDMHYIRSSFRSDYRLDLNQAPDLHWWEFLELLQGLTDNCVLNRVRDVRNYDLSSIKDAKARAKMARAQRELALTRKLSQEDQDTLDDFYAQLRPIQTG